MKRSTIFSTKFDCWQTSVYKLLKSSDLKEAIGSTETVLIKPNLVESLAPPITTPVELLYELVSYLQQELPNLHIIIGEGTGAKDYETHHCFETLGFTGLASKTGVELMDLNHEPFVEKSRPKCIRWPTMHLPTILDEVFLLSVPVLKAHTLAEVTLTMKNMMGCPPPRHYQQGGYWKKSSFHHEIHRAVFDLNCYRTPDYTILDATVGMAESHLWGARCNPPVNILAAGKDPVAMDAYGALLLGLEWQSIEHIALADGKLGNGSGYIIQHIEGVSP